MSAGLVGIVLIASYFSLEMQGFYYTFASLIALQSFVELGFYLVISNCASHEWSRLHVDRSGRIEGSRDSRSRLVSLGRFVFKWYAAAALIFLVLAGVGGYWFLGQASDHNVNWQIPWLAHIVCSAMLLWCMPFLFLLEGCDQVAEVARFRTWQAVVSNLAMWIAILLGAGLWAVPALSMTSALLTLYFLLIRKRAFFKPFLRLPESERMHWRMEVFPMQWRLALQGVMSYFVFSLFTPVMFYYHGPVVAGQMGMTWQAVTAIQSVAIIWVSTKLPRFGVMVARREFRSLDLQWRKATLIALLGMVSGTTILFLCINYLTAIHWNPVNRLLAPWSFLMLAGGGAFALIVQCLAIYLRAHKREVLTPVATITGILMCLTVWQFGIAYGASGAASSYLIVMATVAFPLVLLIWRRCRHEWHQ